MDSLIDKCNDSILNKLVSNSFKIIKSDEYKKFLDLKNLSKFL